MADHEWFGLEWMTEAPLPRPYPDPDAESTAIAWLRTQESLIEIDARFSEHNAHPDTWRARRRRRTTGKLIVDERRGLTEHCTSLQRRLTDQSVGATSSWSALSTLAGGMDRSLCVEDTISRHRAALPTDEVDGLLARLPKIRSLVQLGQGQTQLEEVHALLLVWARNTPSSDTSRELGLHLPGDLRPLPAVLQELPPPSPHVRLCVSQPDPRASLHSDNLDRTITLHDIVVYGQGRGLGSSVLEHLCRFADREGVSITGELIPTLSESEARRGRLARWYARHGFVMGSQPSASWPVGGRMRRAPACV